VVSLFDRFFDGIVVSLFEAGADFFRTAGRREGVGFEARGLNFALARREVGLLFILGRAGVARLTGARRALTDFGRDNAGVLFDLRVFLTLCLDFLVFDFLVFDFLVFDFESDDLDLTV
jgi:hypothetical protein